MIMGRKVLRVLFFAAETGTVFGSALLGIFGEPGDKASWFVFGMWVALPIISLCLWRSDDSLAILGVGSFLVVVAWGGMCPVLK